MPAETPTILQLIQANPAQAEAIAHHGDAVVTAGAGTGKTRTLVARYLALLESGVPLRRIVAITFTRKAAREMRNRVRQQIRAWQPRAGEPERTAFWQQCYADLDAAYIGTIHGLCAAILRAHPAEAGVDPGFGELDEGLGGLLKRRAVEGALRWAAGREEMLGLFRALGVDDLTGVLLALLAQRLEAAEAFAALDDQPLSRWEAALCQRLARFLADPAVQGALDDLQALRDGGEIARAEAAGDKLPPYLYALLAARERLRSALAAGEGEAALAALAELRDAMNIQVGAAKNWRADPKAAIKALRGRYDAEAAPWAGKGASWALDRQAAALLPPLRDLFAQAQAEYARLKEERGALDYDDLEGLALGLLEGRPAVAAAWQARVSALLVDEYQDTNQRQRRLVDLLGGGGGTRFVVGDAKQSIYRFRGADVTVFRETQDEIERDGGKHVALTETYRAHAALVEGLNALLAPVLGTADAARPHAVPFEPLTSARPSPRDGIRPPYIEALLGLGEDADAGRALAAQALARRLRALRADGVGYGEMAILFRASTTFHYYEDALEAAGIPYVTIAGRGFYGRAEIRDLLGALRALADPTDDLAVAGLLRSPALGLSDAALYRLRWTGETPMPLWAALREWGPRLEGDDGSRAARALNLLEPLQQLAGRVAVAELLKRFLDATGYPAIARFGGDERAQRNIAKFLQDAHRSGLVSVTEFLEYVDALRGAGAREGEAPVEALGAVQLMSIHQSKGLEFPVVALADLAHGGGGHAGALLLSPRWGPLLSLAEDKVAAVMYRLEQLEEADREAAEEARLLYVAATRAADKLILNGHATSQKKGGGLAFRGWLQLLAPILGLDALDWGSVDLSAGEARLHLPRFPHADLTICAGPASMGDVPSAEPPPAQPAEARSPLPVRSSRSRGCSTTIAAHRSASTPGRWATSSAASPVSP